MLLLFFSSQSAEPETLDLWQALQAWYEDTPAVQLAGGFWTDEAPLDAELPYAVAIEVSQEIEPQIGTADCEEVQIQISIFGASANQVSELGKTWLEALRFAALPVGDAALEGFEPTGGRRRKDPDRGPDGRDVWIRDLDFTAYLSREYEA